MPDCHDPTADHSITHVSPDAMRQIRASVENPQPPNAAMLALTRDYMQAVADGTLGTDVTTPEEADKWLRQNSASKPPGVMAPWTPEQVAALNAYQERGEYHPFTCPGEHDACDGRRELVAGAGGWVCKCGQYRQNWAHASMMEPPLAGGPD